MPEFSTRQLRPLSEQNLQGTMYVILLVQNEIRTKIVRSLELERKYDTCYWRKK